MSDPFERLRAHTPARIGLGRSGDGLPTRVLLELQAAHGRARDAVHRAVDFEALARELAEANPVRVHSRADDRSTYLRRPDLGRRLREADRARLAELAQPSDLVVVVGDGLSADAVTNWAAPVVRSVRRRLSDWTLGPLVLAEQARVALGDEIGEVLGARLVAVLLGERPGLSVADSLGIYATFHPEVGRTDAERNCISNVHAAGASPEAAAEQLARLLVEARRKRLTGVGLQVEANARLGDELGALGSGEDA